MTVSLALSFLSEDVCVEKYFSARNIFLILLNWPKYEKVIINLYIAPIY